MKYDENFELFIDNLKKNEIDYSNWKGDLNTIQERVDGKRQIWIQDPQGYWIEINDIHSKPKEPTPEYKSKIFEFFISTLIRLECNKILKIFSLTESLRGLVTDDFRKLIFFPFKLPLIILIFLDNLPTYIFSVKTTFPT